MATQKQLSGMQGVFLVAAELSKRGIVASPTSRNAEGADMLATDTRCQKAFAVQVKTNARTFSFWLVGANTTKSSSPSHVYVFVNLRKTKTEFFIVPSRIVAENVEVSRSTTGSIWYSFPLRIAKRYEDNWDLFSQ